MGKQNHARGSAASNQCTEQRRTVAGRLEKAGLHSERFIDVTDGRKQSYDHTRLSPDAVAGNYGVYCGRGLLGFDIDDYNGHADTRALEGLPATFTVRTPHGGEHHYFKSVRGASATIRAATGGARNVSLNWGEIYGGGKYLVGPGSEITDCNKTGCTDTENHESYAILDDRPIAEIGPESVRSVLSAQAGHAGDVPQSALATYGVQDGERIPRTNNRTRSRQSGASASSEEQRAVDSEQAGLDSFR
ncbi:bifunctional DNA primase/polymerase [Haloarchaeobius salinus]|uniref:bifunctional DNA primase/polymerase n=1 Tax=Haloarchaeobius salinus TaxID=1198298 RepID=UPI00210BECA4|nr:bifunctional DNA primase/polymerase [Haloarchaeobius salinus]